MRFILNKNTDENIRYFEVEFRTMKLFSCLWNLKIITTISGLTYARPNIITPFRSAGRKVFNTLDDFGGFSCIAEHEAWRTVDISKQYVLFHSVGDRTIASQFYIRTTWSYSFKINSINKFKVLKLNFSKNLFQIILPEINYILEFLYPALSGIISWFWFMHKFVKYVGEKSQ